MDFTAILDKYGLPVFILFVVGYAGWYILTRVIIPTYEDTRKAEMTSAEGYRNAILNELVDLKKDDKERDYRIMDLWEKQIGANIQNALSNVQLSESLEKINYELKQHNDQIQGLSNKVAELQSDVHNVYIIVGKDKKVLSIGE